MTATPSMVYKWSKRLAAVEFSSGSRMIYEARTELVYETEFRYVHRWKSLSRDSWGTLVIIHGLGDHGERYWRLAEWFAERGVNVLAMDLVGHGRSPGRRGCIASYDALLTDVVRAVELANQRSTEQPCFLFGQSMGGNLVLNAALRNRPQLQSMIDGVISCGAMLKAGKPIGEQFLSVGQKLSEWFPNFRMKTPVQVERLCRSKEAQNEYLDDELVHQMMSLRLGIELVRSGLWAIDHADELAIPTLMMHGGNDELTSPEATIQFAEAADFASLKIWPGLQHDLHFEPEWQTVLAFIRKWMTKVIQESSFTQPMAA